jgi:branched-chain amino acid transport system substrate-binding protein
MPIFTTATSPAVLKPGPWVFKVTETADQYMKVLGDYVVARRKPKSCFNLTIRDNEGYILQANVFRDVIKAGGINVAAEESILAADTDFTALGTKITSSKADCLFLSTPPEQGANIILQARQAGMSANTLLVGNTGMASINYAKAGGAAVEGTIFPAESVPTGVNDLAKAFIQSYTKRYKVAPDSWAMVGYSMMLVAGNAIKAAGPNPTREKVREAMLATKNLPVVIGRGTWSVDPATRIPTFGYAVMETRGGKFDTAK